MTSRSGWLREVADSIGECMVPDGCIITDRAGCSNAVRFSVIICARKNHFATRKKTGMRLHTTLSTVVAAALVAAARALQRNSAMNKLLLTACCVAMFASGGALAADPVAGKEKSKTCTACHGQDGNSTTPDFPRLAGQHYDYVVQDRSFRPAACRSAAPARWFRRGIRATRGIRDAAG